MEISLILGAGATEAQGEKRWVFLATQLPVLPLGADC